MQVVGGHTRGNTERTKVVTQLVSFSQWHEPKLHNSKTYFNPHKGGGNVPPTMREMRSCMDECGQSSQVRTYSDLSFRRSLKPWCRRLLSECGRTFKGVKVVFCQFWRATWWHRRPLTLNHCKLDWNLLCPSNVVWGLYCETSDQVLKSFLQTQHERSWCLLRAGREVLINVTIFNKTRALFLCVIAHYGTFHCVSIRWVRCECNCCTDVNI